MVPRTEESLSRRPVRRSHKLAELPAGIAGGGKTGDPQAEQAAEQDAARARKVRLGVCKRGERARDRKDRTGLDGAAHEFTAPVAAYDDERRTLRFAGAARLVPWVAHGNVGEFAGMVGADMATPLAVLLQDLAPTLAIADAARCTLRAIRRL